MTKTISAEQFEQNVRTFLDAVQQGDEVIIERDGRSVARMVPTQRRPRRSLEEMRGSVKILGDIVGPVNDPEDWEAMK
jgi:antitoxin (DNA-binding transcriptional repressor) of toxin-antitoxin stability system